MSCWRVKILALKHIVLLVITLGDMIIICLFSGEPLFVGKNNHEFNF